MKFTTISTLVAVLASAAAAVDVQVPPKFTFKFTTAGTQLDQFPDVVIDSKAALSGPTRLVLQCN